MDLDNIKYCDSYSLESSIEHSYCYIQFCIIQYSDVLALLATTINAIVHSHYEYKCDYILTLQI